MMFGGWAEEDDERSALNKSYDAGFRDGSKVGHENGISKCQLAISQSLNLSYEQKIKLWDELEKLRWK